MAATKIAVIGSCVTRDIWRVLDIETSHLHFTARASFISLVSAPLPDGTQAELPPQAPKGFERMCVLADINKTSLRSLESFEPEVIILDFMEERFDILRIADSFVTYTAELIRAGGLSLPWARSGAVLDRLDPQTTWFWIKSVQLFLGRLARSPALRGVPVLLHRAPWALHCVSGGQQTGPTIPRPSVYHIEPNKLVSVHQYSMLTQCYYEIFVALHPSTILVEAPRSLHIASEEHCWGSSPFHYIDAYYEAVAARLRALGIL